MNPEIPTLLVRGRKIGMPDRIPRVLWPAPPIQLCEVEPHLARILRIERWFPDDPFVVAQAREKVFSNPGEASAYYVRWDLHLRGDLDGWRVVE